MFLWVTVVSVVFAGLALALISVLRTSPVVRRYMQTRRRSSESPDSIAQLADRIARLESEFEDLSYTVEQLREEGESTQRLLEDAGLGTESQRFSPLDP